MNTLLTNWKTTSLGLTAIAGAVIHLVFQIKSGEANENAWTIAVGGVIVGLGFLLAGDANKSATKADIHDIKRQMAEVPSAINTGDTRFLSNAIDKTNPPTQPPTP